jgi:hypothetical protein
MNSSPPPNQRIDSRLESIRPTLQEAVGKFRRHQVEILLNSASDLLNRCLIERQRADELASIIARDDLSNQFDVMTIETQQRRLDSGWYDLSLQLADRNDKLLRELRGLYEESERTYSEYFDTLRGDAKKAVAPALSLNSVALKRWMNEVELAFVKAQQERNAGADNTEIVNENRLRRSIQAQKKAYEYKGGPLDLKGQIDVIQSRIEEDYKDAAMRLTAASLGLQQVYGFSEASFLQSLNFDEVGAIDSAIRWTRGAIRWLAAFSSLDQSFATTLSLKSTLEPEDFLKLKDGKRVAFAVPWALFQSHKYVRVRGLSASLLMPNSSQEIGAAEIALPIDAVYEFIAKGGDPTLSPIVDQSDLPSCHLGRLLPLHVPQQQEVAGAVSLFNASPLGSDTKGSDPNWRIQMKSITSNCLDTLTDVIITVYATGLPRKRIYVGESGPTRAPRARSKAERQ